METAATKIARLDRSIARTGETVTLQRTSTDATGAVTVALELADCPAHVRDNQPQDLLDNSVREARVILGPTHLLAAEIEAAMLREDGSRALREDGSALVLEALDTFGLPQKDDHVLIQGNPSNVENIAPIYYGGQLVRVNLLCRG